MEGGSAKRIQNELGEIIARAPEEFSACPKGDNLFEWSAAIHGPSGALRTPGQVSSDQKLHRALSFVFQLVAVLKNIR